LKNKLILYGLHILKKLNIILVDSDINDKKINIENNDIAISEDNEKINVEYIITKADIETELNTLKCPLYGKQQKSINRLKQHLLINREFSLKKYKASRLNGNSLEKLNNEHPCVIYKHKQKKIKH